MTVMGTKPPKKNSTAGKISREKCLAYQDERETVNAILVFGGQKAKAKVYKHMAALGYQATNTDAIAWLCGGSLISENFILTAAHCVTSKEFGPVKLVRLGALDLNNSSDTADPPIDVTVKQIYAHPGFKPPQHYNDIALLQLSTNVKPTVAVKTACLNTDDVLTSDSNSKKKYIVTGWGKTDFAGDASSHLIEAYLDLVPHAKCNARYASVSRRRLPSGILERSQICAGDAVGKDTCPGDSGGPLQEDIPATDELQRYHRIIGITSFGRGCGVRDSVGVYTRVSDYLDWIENIVWPQN